MAQLSQIVVVNITKESRGVTRQGFGIPLLLSPHVAYADRVRSYSSSSAVGTDFGLTSAEYAAAQIAFSQSIKPSAIQIGRQRVGAIQSLISTLATPSLSFTITVNEPPQAGDTVAYVFQKPNGTKLFTLAVSTDATTAIAEAWKDAIEADGDYSATWSGSVITVTTSLAVYTGVVYVSRGDENGDPYRGHQFAVGGSGAYVTEITDENGANPTVVVGIISGDTAAVVADRIAKATSILGVINDGDNANIFGSLASATTQGGGLYTVIFDADRDYGNVTVDAKQTLTTSDTGRGVSSVGGASVDLSAIEDAGVALAAVTFASNTWYGLVTMVPSFGNAFGEETAVTIPAKTFVEANERLYIALSLDPIIINSTASADTTSVAYQFKAASIERTAVLYHDNAGEFADLAWLARMLPTAPGSATWKFKTLRGVTFSNLTDTQAANALAKNANTYESFAGTNLTREGTVASGEFIDVIVGLDWVVVNMRADVFDGLANAPKIPFTNKGIASIVNLVKARLTLAVGQGIFSDNPAPVVTAPDVVDVDPADKAARFLRTIDWDATLQGAVHKVQVEGHVSI